VAGGMELALRCDVRMIAESAYPLIDDATVRPPRLAGLDKALEIIMTGRKATAEGSYRRGLAMSSRGPSAGGSRGHGAGDRPFPAGVHARRPAVGLSRLGQVAALGPGKRVGDERRHRPAEGIAGATRFASGKAGGDFKDI